jgi:DNA-binding transcriptional regulator PaaX
VNGWIKLHRQIIEWEWYKDDNTKSLFFHLLLSANHEAKNHRGILIEVGQVQTGRKKLALELGKTERQIRTAIKRLQTTNEITVKTTNKFSIITLVNYPKYQHLENENDQLNDQQDVPKTTTNKNNKNIRNKYMSSFPLFWEQYPKKVAKAAANKIWDRLKPNEELFTLILQGLEKAKKSEQWTMDNEKYIPYATTFLNQQRWEDEYSNNTLRDTQMSDTQTLLGKRRL